MPGHQTRLVHDSIEAESDLLSINWTQVGLLLEEFVERVLDELGIPELVHELPNSRVVHQRRHYAAMFLADLLGIILTVEGNAPETVAKR